MSEKLTNFKELHDQFLSFIIKLLNYIEKHVQTMEKTVFDTSIDLVNRLILYQLLKEKGLVKKNIKDIIEIKQKTLIFPGFNFFPDMQLSAEEDSVKDAMKLFQDINDFFKKLSIKIKLEFIGNVFENLLTLWEEFGSKSSDESISKRLTKRKTKGVFYTPSRITKYMVDRILKEKLFDGLSLEYPIASIPNFIDNYPKKHVMKLFEIVRDIKILDPACGSGAFLLESCKVLYKVRIQIGEIRGKELDPLKLKISIIKNNIFGVDIFAHATNMVKLRALFWMFNEINKLNDLILFDFEKNFRVGNALYGFNWKDNYSAIFSDESTGFDIVISNPPYGRTILTNQLKNLTEFLVSSKGKVRKPTYNASALFLERGIKLLNSSGYLAMIVPSSVARTEEFEGIRNYILDHTNLFEIVDEGKAFDNKHTHTKVTLEMITIFLKKSKVKDNLVHIISKRDGTTRFVNKDVFKKYDRFILYHDFIFDTIMDGSKINLIHARSGIDHRLIKYTQKKDQVRKKSKDYPIPFLHSGKAVQRYHLNESQFHFIREENLLKDRFKEEFNKENLLTVAISPFIRASMKNSGIIPGTNTQIISITNENENYDIFYYLALLNSKILRMFFHIYFQNKIKYTFKIQDYHVKFYPIKHSSEGWIFSLFSRILTNFLPKKQNLAIFDQILDYLVIELYLGDFFDSNLIVNVKKLLIKNQLDSYNQVNKDTLENFLLKIKENDIINNEMRKIKEKLILDENELEIKILKIGCNYDG